jgi:hypothetical protein
VLVGRFATDLNQIGIGQHRQGQGQSREVIEDAQMLQTQALAQGLGRERPWRIEHLNLIAQHGAGDAEKAGMRAHHTLLGTDIGQVAIDHRFHAVEVRQRITADVPDGLLGQALERETHIGAADVAEKFGEGIGR